MRKKNHTPSEASIVGEYKSLDQRQSFFFSGEDHRSTTSSSGGEDCGSTTETGQAAGQGFTSMSIVKIRIIHVLNMALLFVQFIKGPTMGDVIVQLLGLWVYFHGFLTPITPSHCR